MPSVRPLPLLYPTMLAAHRQESEQKAVLLSSAAAYLERYYAQRNAAKAERIRAGRQELEGKGALRWSLAGGAVREWACWGCSEGVGRVGCLVWGSAMRCVWIGSGSRWSPSCALHPSLFLPNS